MKKLLWAKGKAKGVRDTIFQFSQRKRALKRNCIKSSPVKLNIEIKLQVHLVMVKFIKSLVQFQ